MLYYRYRLIKEVEAGNTYARVTLTTFSNASNYTDHFLVDTGATDSVAPSDKLKELGVMPEGSMRYEMADGRKVSFQFGAAKFEVLGRVTWGKIVFGPEGSEPLLGVTVLESVALRVNPLTKKLEKLPAALMK